MINDLPAVLMIAQALQKQIKRIENKPCHCITLRDSLCSSPSFIEKSPKLQLIFEFATSQVLVQLVSSFLVFSSTLRVEIKKMVKYCRDVVMHCVNL